MRALSVIVLDVGSNGAAKRLLSEDTIFLKHSDLIERLKARTAQRMRCNSELGEA